MFRAAPLKNILVNETPGGERLDLRIIWKRSYPGLLSCHSYGVWPWLLVVLLADFATSKISANILAVTHVTVIDATGADLLPDRTSGIVFSGADR